MKTKWPVEKGDWRKRQYESSTAFEEARIVVEHDLRQSAKTHRREVETFLTWVREYGKTASTGETRKKIETFPSEVRDSLWLYVDFVLRFRVFLKSIKQNGVPDFVPEYVKPRHSQLKVGFSEGKLVLPKTDPDTDCRDRLASVGGVPAQIRRAVKAKRARILMPEQNEAANLAMQTRGVSEEELDYLRAVQRLRGSNPEDAKLRIVEVHARDKSALTRLMDHAYDPLAATLLLVRSRRQTRLLWLEGELLNDDEWKQLGSVRAVTRKLMRGKTTAGAPLDLHQFARDLGHIPVDGKISKELVNEATVGPANATHLARQEKRLQRAKSRADRVRRQMAS